MDVGESTSNGVHVVLRMRGTTRRILRSPEIGLIVPKPASTISAATSNPTARGAGGYILIDLNCTIQYSHVLKIDSNVLQILLQKRKKYKNTTMNLGYKTLAYCNISLSQVLQRRIEHRFLDMYPDPKCIGSPIARMEVNCICTVPWERDPVNAGHKGEVESDGCLDDGCLLPADVFFDDESDSEDQEMEDGVEEGDASRCDRVVSAPSAASANADRRAQKKVLKPMSVGDIDTGTTLHLWDEIDKMEAISDVEDSDLETGGTAESGSLQSAPRPSIRPFFGHTGSSEETLSLDAGARLLRRLQKEALLVTGQSSTPSSQTCQQRSPRPAMSADSEPRAQSSNGASAAAKFSPRFGSTKMRRTAPLSKRRQASPSTSVSKDLFSTNGHSENQSHLKSSARFHPINADDDLSDSNETGVESSSLVNTEIPSLPDSLCDVQFIVNTLEPGGKVAAAALTQAGCCKLARVSSFNEVKQVMSGLVSWAQLHLDRSRWVRFCVVGGDTLISAVLRAYVELVGARSESVAAAFRFFLVPVSGLVGRSHRRRSTSTTLPPISHSTDPIRLPYSGSPSLLQDSTIPLSLSPLSNLISQRLCGLDVRYALLFRSLAVVDVSPSSVDPQDTALTPVRGKHVPSDSPCSPDEFVRRVVLYLTNADSLLSLPIGECLVAGARSFTTITTGAPFGAPSNQAASSCLLPDFNPPLPLGTKSMGGSGNLEDESGQQTLVPFLLCISLGGEAILRSCFYPTEAGVGAVQGPISPVSTCFDAGGGGGGDHSQSSHPPSAPHSATRPPLGGPEKPTYELQLEYWTLSGGASTSSASVAGPASFPGGAGQDERGGGAGGADGGSGRVAARPITCKATCKSMVVAQASSPLTATPQQPNACSFLSLALVTREKKPKIMRIGKKTAKEVVFKPELTDGVTRLICTCKGVIYHTHECESGTAAATRLGHPAAAEAALSGPMVVVEGSTARPDACVPRSTSHFSPKDDLGCGLVTTPTPNASGQTVTSGDQVFVRVSIDGVDWPTSRFFQVAPGWRTHVKTFPLVCMSPCPPASPPLAQAFALPLAQAMLSTGHVHHPMTAVGVAPPAPSAAPFNPP
ncbi:unnamed protein product [Mesocestoides corti]|uniref:Uncharacterized protein n=1 Tax=Mesocestoides corti TaxID=53468 RepID=A0A158QUS8_MESCO|nr:unnamed protein product [Mesocestoides corti]